MKLVKMGSKGQTRSKRARRTLNTNMNVILLTGLSLPASIISLRERIEGLEILDVRGHEIDCSARLVLRRSVNKLVLGEWRVRAVGR